MMSNKALQLNEQWANEVKDQLAYSLHQCGSDMTVIIDTIGIDTVTLKVSDNTMNSIIWAISYGHIKNKTKCNEREGRS